MAEKAYGILYGVLEEKRIIEIRDRRKVNFYYMSKGIFKSFMMYFTSGMYVFLTVSDTPRIHRGLKVKNVISIDKVLSPNKNKPKIYFDISIIKSGVKRILNDPRNKLFLDFEMSMPPYTDYESFVSEIIQVGYVLTDKDGQTLESFESYVKPHLHPKISLRTMKFLHIEQTDIDGGIPYRDFYNKLDELIRKYNPMIFVWGKNDQLELAKLNKIHHLRNITKQMRFIDMLNLHKIYYGLKNDIGLFNAFNLYFDADLSKQKHNAMEDAMVTKRIYDGFKHVCNHNLVVKIDS
ncbi:MAG TPA: 3'-5' exonuclease [Bacillota bacterium]|nr:3'-5' exonuclease [Bacillota bacterium]